jgi:hypothetical protein
MLLKATVFKESFDHYPASDKGPARDVFSLLIIDMSEPANHRMEELLHYKLTDEEKSKYWGKAAGQTLQISTKRIAHTKAGKAMLIGTIVEASKN